MNPQTKRTVGTTADNEEYARWKAIAKRQGINMSKLLYKAMTYYEQRLAPVERKPEEKKAS